MNHLKTFWRWILRLLNLAPVDEPRTLSEKIEKKYTSIFGDDKKMTRKERRYVGQRIKKHSGQKRKYGYK